MKQTLANGALIALALFYIIMLGGGNYEQLNITLLVTNALPKSLYILQGDFSFRPFAFWALFRPITILLFILAIVLNWKFMARRKFLIAAFSLDIVITIATYTYFAPETEIIVNIPYHSQHIDTTLIERVMLWKNLNWIRLGGFYLGGILLLISLTKSTGQSVE